jgi:hypothetical protein
LNTVKQGLDEMSNFGLFYRAIQAGSSTHLLGQGPFQVLCEIKTKFALSCTLQNLDFGKVLDNNI